jgi:hypothetical protein
MSWVRCGCAYSRVKVYSAYSRPAGWSRLPVLHATATRAEFRSAGAPRMTAAQSSDRVAPGGRPHSIGRHIVGRPTQAPRHLLVPVGRALSRGLLTPPRIPQPSPNFDKNAKEYRAARHDAPSWRRSTFQCSPGHRKCVGERARASGDVVSGAGLRQLVAGSPSISRWSRLKFSQRSPICRRPIVKWQRIQPSRQ